MKIKKMILIKCILSLTFVVWCISGCGFQAATNKFSLPLEATRSAEPSDVSLSDVSLSDVSLSDVSLSVGSLQKLYLRADGSLIGVTDRGKLLLWRQSGSPKVSPKVVKLGRPEVVLELGEEVYASSFNVQSDLMAVGLDGRVVMISIEDPANIVKLSELKGRFNALAIAPDASSILFTRTDNKVYRWKFNSSRKGELLAWRRQRTQFERYIGHAAVVSAVAFHPLGGVFFSADWDGVLFAWQTYDADDHGGAWDRNSFYSRFYTDVSKRVAGVVRSGEVVESLAVGAEGKRMATGYASGVIEFWLVRGLKLTHAFKFHSAAIEEIAFAPDGDEGFSLSRDGALAWWLFKAGSKPEFKILATRDFPQARTLLIGSQGLFLGNVDSSVEFVPFEVLKAAG